MKREMEFLYGKIPAENRAKVEKLHTLIQGWEEKKNEAFKSIHLLQGTIARLLTDIRPGDLVKHDAEAKYLRKAEVDKHYLVTSVSLGYSGLKFMGRKIKKDGQPTDRDTELYVGIDGRLIKIGRYRRRRAVCTTT